MTYAIKIHFSRPGAKKGRPWTLHYRGKCRPASSVVLHNVSAITNYIPTRPSEPRAFLSVKGLVRFSGATAHVTQE